MPKITENKIDSQATRTTLYIDNDVKAELDKKIGSRKKSLFINEAIRKALEMKLTTPSKPAVKNKPKVAEKRAPKETPNPNVIDY